MDFQSLIKFSLIVIAILIVQFDFLQLYDKDNSGTIEMSEMVEILHTIYVMEGMSAAMDMAKNHARQIFTDLDEDKNGTLTLEEFIDGCLHDRELVSLISKGDDESENSESCQEKALNQQRNIHGLDISGETFFKEPVK